MSRRARLIQLALTAALAVAMGGCGGSSSAWALLLHGRDWIAGPRLRAGAPGNVDEIARV